MESVQPVENRDGIPLKKNFDLWLSNHGGERRKALSLKSLAAHHQWCSHCNFVENFALLSKVVQAAFETSVKEGSRQVSQIEAAIAKGLPPLLRMTDQLSHHIKLIAFPLSHRFVELQLDPETELKDVPRLLKEALGRSDSDSKMANAIFESFKSGEQLKRLQEGKSADVLKMSPIHCAASVPKPTAEAPSPADIGATPNIARQLGFMSDSSATPQDPQAERDADSPECTPDGEDANYGLRKKRNAPQVYEPTNCKKNRQRSNQKDKSKGRRVYNRSGLYSKDPVKAAMARERMKNRPTLSGEGNENIAGINGTAGVHATFESHVCVHLRAHKPCA